jgi:hypothetical protein
VAVCHVLHCLLETTFHWKDIQGWHDDDDDDDSVLLAPIDHQTSIYTKAAILLFTF